MLTRPFPGGEAVPVIGLGTSRVFDVAPSPESLAPLDAVVRTLLDAGGTLIDTAPSYGRAEPVTGALLARDGRRHRAFVATKISSQGRAASAAQFRQSLADLKTDRVDMLQVHNLIDLDNLLALARELKAEGRTRYVGITHYVESAQDEVLAVLRRERVDCVQINYSVAARGAERHLLPYCADHGIAVLINRPFVRGDLFAKVKDRPLPDWAAEVGATSWAQLMLKYVIAHPAVTAVIPATSKAVNMADNAGAGYGPLPDAALRQRIVDALA
ncbi:MAG: aldo/keto reductase [Burkholderiales bacterium]|nr:aldo/keto reductase [Burkholderiales bacterium]